MVCPFSYILPWVNPTNFLRFRGSISGNAHAGSFSDTILGTFDRRLGVPSHIIDVNITYTMEIPSKAQRDEFAQFGESIFTWLTTKYRLRQWVPLPESKLSHFKKIFFLEKEVERPWTLFWD